MGIPLTASAGSDVPYGSALGDVRVYAHLGDTPFSADAWFAAFDAGHTFVTNGVMLDLEVEGRIPGSTFTTDGAEPLTVTARAFGQPGNSAPQTLQIIALSEVREEAASTDPTLDSLTLDAKISLPYGGWVAAYAKGHDGSLAHTTPVYVHREGFRPWNYARVPALLAAREASVAEVETMTDNAVRMAEAGGIHPQDRLNQTFAANAAALREDIAEVRTAIAALREAYNREEQARP